MKNKWRSELCSLTHMVFFFTLGNSWEPSVQTFTEYLHLSRRRGLTSQRCRVKLALEAHVFVGEAGNRKHLPEEAEAGDGTSGATVATVRGFYRC